MTNSAQPEPCVYTHLENGIHEFIFNRSSREAVDEMFVMLSEVYEDVDPDRTIPLLFDFQRGDVPLSYLFMSFQKWLAGRTTHYNARLVILTDMRGVAPILDGFLRALHHSYLQVRFFSHAQRNEIVDWLLEEG